MPTVAADVAFGLGRCAGLLLLRRCWTLIARRPAFLPGQPCAPLHPPTAVLSCRPLPPSLSTVPCRYSLPPEVVQAAVHASLALVGLAAFAERPTSSLSGGQKQRVAIAGALAECPRVRRFRTGWEVGDGGVTPQGACDGLARRNPVCCCGFVLPSTDFQLVWCGVGGPLQVLLLDELTTFLDYEDQENVLQCVRGIVDSSRHQQQQLQQQQGGGAAASGVTALWVTHRLEELDYADSVR